MTSARRSHRPSSGFVCVLAFALCGAACDFDASTTPPTGGKLGVGQATAMATALAFIERATGTVFLVDAPAPTGKPRVRMLEVARNPVAWQVRPGAAARMDPRDELLVLSQGFAGGGGIDAEEPTLSIVEATGGVVTPIKMPARFNALSVSPDGRFAIAYFAGQMGPGGDVIFNPNLIAIVDLANPAVPPQARTLRSKGSVPLAFGYSPRMGLANALPDGDRMLAVIRSENYVTLMDLEHLGRGEITVPLVQDGDGRKLTPVQIEFDADQVTLYVRVSGASDVFSLRLEPVPAAERVGGGNDFRPSVSQFAAGVNPTDMEIYKQGDQTRLLVVAGDRIVVIDALTARATTIPLEHRAVEIYGFQVLKAGEARPRQQALLIGDGGENRLSFVDLDNLETLKTRNLDMEAMTGEAVVFAPFPAEKQALVQHRNGVSVIQLDTRNISPLLGSIDLRNMRTSALQPDRLWLRSPGAKVLSFIDLKTQALGFVRLDVAAEDLAVVNAGAAGARLLVVHASNEGFVTALDAARPDRATAHSIQGFAALNILDRTERSVP